MSIGVCVRMDEWRVVLFTLALPFLVMTLSFVLRFDTELRKELDTLEPGTASLALWEAQCYFGDDM